jgi:6-phosphogluconolactonase
MTIEPFADEAALAQAAARIIADALRAAIVARGQALFVATGGRTPGGVYDWLSAAELDWSNVVVTLSDERWAPIDSPDRNERLIRERLLKGPAAAGRFMSLIGDASTPRAAAAQADAALRPLGAPDVVLLGMGEDGHIASLFPLSPALSLGLDPKAPICISVPPGEQRPPPQARITLTAPWLVKAPDIFLLITGQEKRTVIAQALAGDDARELPVRAILQSSARVRIFWSA